jgi:hypothetical protein
VTYKYVLWIGPLLVGLDGKIIFFESLCDELNKMTACKLAHVMNWLDNEMLLG